MKPAQAEPTPIRVPRRVFATAVLLLAVFCRKESNPSSLAKAYAEEPYRIAELRMSGLDYKPHHPQERRPPGLQAAAYEYVRDSRNSGRDPRWLAVAHMAMGKPAEATAILTRATAVHPLNASLWSNLAATLAEEARLADDLQLVARSLAASDRALRLNATSAEALFNRAACLQALGLNKSAASAWRRYLSVDGGSSWADEGRQRLGHIRHAAMRRDWPAMKLRLVGGKLSRSEIAAIVREYPQESRTFGEGECLSAWGEAVIAGRHADAEAALKLAHVIGSALVETRGELFLSDAVAVLMKEPVAALAEAHANYKRARLLIGERQPTEAIALLSEAERAFHAHGSPMAHVSAMYRAGALFDAHRHAEAVALFRSIPHQRGHDALHAYVLWQQGQIAGRRGELYEALTTTERALNIFERLGETDNAIRLLSNRANLLAALGRDDDAWRMRGEVFIRASLSENAELTEAALHAAGLDEVSAHRYDSASALLKVFLEAPSQSPIRRFEAALYRAFAASRLNALSRKDIENLRTIVGTIKDEQLRMNASDELRFVQSLMVRDSNPALAARMLTTCVAYRERHHTITRMETYVERGRAYRLMRRTPDAVRDFARALDIIESVRADIDSNDLRDSFFTSAATACDELLDAQLVQGAGPEAFITADRCRQRTLSDLLGLPRQTNTALRPDAIQRELGRSEAMLHYTALPKTLVIFVITPDGFVTRMSSIGRDELMHAGNNLRKAAAKRDHAAIAVTLRQLHRLLIAPVESSIREAKALTIVPDETLAATPFAALIDSTATHLVERYAVSIAPSARTSIASALDHASSNPRVAIIADPAFETSIAVDLPRLPGARGEATLLGRIYSDVHTLTDTDATRRRVLRALHESDIIHFATHAVINPRDSRSSALVLAPENDDGLLYLPIIRDQRLAQHPLIILAGCQTGVPAGGSGSIRSLAAAFLAAGSRGVIASLWNIDDLTTRRFSAELHRQIGAGLPPAIALRETQLTMLRARDSELRVPAAWGAVQYYRFGNTTERKDE